MSLKVFKIEKLNFGGISLKMINEKYINFCLSAFISLFFIASINAGEINFKKNDADLICSNAAFGIQLKDNKQKLTLGCENRDQRFEFIVTLVIENTNKLKESFFDLETSQIMVMFKSKHNGVFSVMPPLQMARSKNLNYVSSNSKSKKNSRNTKTKPSWIKWNKAKRIQHGKGIIKNKFMQGARFSLHLIPVYEGDTLKKIKGSFSGMLKKNNIKNGSFDLEVAK